MRLSSRLLSLGLMALLSSVAHAQSTKPGLWEINQKVGGNRAYACTYSGARMLYWAYFVPRNR